MGDRARIALVCDECTERNYHTTKSRKNQRGERLTIKKFCPRCNKHTKHSESK